MDAESNLACSQLCLSQQVFKKANKKASLTPNKQTLKFQVGKKSKQGGNEDKSRVDGAGGVAMILFGGHCPRQAGRERLMDSHHPARMAQPKEHTANPVVPAHMLHFAELVAVTQDLHCKAHTH